jgi:hypothetical protein
MANIQDVEQQVAQDEEVADITIYQKDGTPYLGADGKPATIGVLGAEAKRYRLARDTATRKLIRGGKAKLEPEDIWKSRIDQAVAGVVRWSGWEHNGQPWPCEPANVAKLLQAEHILVQVEAGVQDHADFFVKPSAS